MKLIKLSILLAMAFIWSGNGLASDEEAEAKLSEATELYSERTDNVKFNQGIALLSAAATLAEDSDLKFSVLILHSKYLLWHGNHVNTDSEKIRIFLARVCWALFVRAYTPFQLPGPFR